MMSGSPDGTIIFWLLMCAAFVVLSGIYSAAETGIYCVSRVRLMVAAHCGSRAAGRLQRLLHDPAKLLSTALLGTNLANYLAPVCLTYLFLRSMSADDGSISRESAARAELYTTLILTPVVFILGEVVPKNIFQRHADRFMPRLAGLLSASDGLFRWTGINALQRSLSRLIMRRLPREEGPRAVLRSRREMYQMLQEGGAEGVLSRGQLSMLESLHRLRRQRVGNVMVPLRLAVMLPADATRRSANSTLRQSRHSRFPVFEQSRRRAVGVVHLLDLLEAPADAAVGTFMRPALYLEASATVIDAISTLQRHRRRMGLVRNRNGECVGLVTVKDLVEEIVGELAVW